jgi:hypothetical protein
LSIICLIKKIVRKKVEKKVFRNGDNLQIVGREWRVRSSKMSLKKKFEKSLKIRFKKSSKIVLRNGHNLQIVGREGT